MQIPISLRPLGLMAFLVLVSLSACGPQSNAAALKPGPGPSFDPGGAKLHRPAPDFTLTDQFGKPFALHDFRGKVVVLSFVDNLCTTLCPLTTQSMLDALRILGPASSQVQLLGVVSNPSAIDQASVMHYSTVHGLVDHWRFGTGSPQQLEAVWTAYQIAVEVDNGSISHTPALYILDPSGYERFVYLTPMEYAGVTQMAYLLAADASQLLPSHPRVLPAAGPQPLDPRSPITLPIIQGTQPTVALGKGTARLTLFFATWVPDLEANFRALNQYALDARSHHLVPLVAVDVGTTEPSTANVRDFLDQAGYLLFPVARDPMGRVTDLYGVQSLAWYVLTDAKGHVLWQHDGWISVSNLEAAVRYNLAHAA